MNKHTIELNIPEGYEPDEGEQPRVGKAGDFYLSNDCLGVIHSSRNHDTAKSIILRKKKPVYVVLELDENGRSDVAPYQAAMGHKLVEIKALEDALEIIDAMNESPILEAGDWNNYKALKELVE